MSGKYKNTRIQMLINDRIVMETTPEVLAVVSDFKGTPFDYDMHKTVADVNAKYSLLFTPGGDRKYKNGILYAVMPSRVPGAKTLAMVKLGLLHELKYTICTWNGAGDKLEIHIF